MAKLFGTDGVRGVANRDLTPELCFKLGRAGASVLAAESHITNKPIILIGRDTRISGDMLQAALSAGILSAGAVAVDLGVATTPAVAWLTKSLDVQAGVMISASHNPVEDNGIKFFSHSGYKLSDEVEARIEEAMHNEPEVQERPIAGAVGYLKRSPELLQQYLDYLAALPDLNLSGLRIAIDCANGAASAIAAEPFKHFGAQVHLLHCHPDGVNINAACGSTHPESLQRYVVDEGMDFGLALDGDADRCLAVDAAGQLIDGDQILAILALALQEKKRLPHNTVAATVMSNLGFHQGLAKHKIHALQTKVGDRYVLEAMLEQGLALGGEQSGHIILSEYATTGDGILTGLMLASRVKETGKTLAELAKVMIQLPQVLLGVRLADKEKAMHDSHFQEAVREQENLLRNRGRILIRPSGTEALLRIMVEAPTHEEAQSVAEQLAEEARKMQN